MGGRLDKYKYFEMDKAIVVALTLTLFGRSLYALVIGLFCGWWTLMALGEVECGLMVGMRRNMVKYTA